MAELINRVLRDGAFDGEYAPALTIKDSLLIPLGFEAFNHFLSNLASNISAGKAQAHGLVLVALCRSPSFYLDLLKRRGFNVAASDARIRILDGYSDPLGWKDRLLDLGTQVKFCQEEIASRFIDVGDMDKLFTSIIGLGRGEVGQGKSRFSVAIDSVSVLLRHASLPSVSGLINNLRSHDQVSCILWLIHSDLLEVRTTAALEYMSSMVASLEPMTQSTDVQSNTVNVHWLEWLPKRGKLNVHLKRRNGRVKVIVEETYMEQADIKFAPISSADAMINQNLLPKVQFNLQLTEKERIERAKVVLPFEHQGNGKSVQIYDGRQSLSHGQAETNSDIPIHSTIKSTTESSNGTGEIHYLRDSDDERPDSDEDPDDDLDI